MLYLIATPIGNLADITLRALDVMKECDYLLCEDTRHSKKLLMRYEISRPLKSFHAHNEREKAESVLQDLRKGMKIGLLSDAGHPCINDPGSHLVGLCHEEKLPVQIIPGPSSIASALSLSGHSFSSFQFLGYVPKKQSIKFLTSALSYPGLSVFFETPHQLRKTLQKLTEIAPDCRITLARELTKRYEEVCKGSPAELLEKFPSPKGEFVLIIEPQEKEQEAYSKEELIKLVNHIETKYGLSRKKTAELLQEFKGISKKDIYHA